MLPTWMPVVNFLRSRDPFFGMQQGMLKTGSDVFAFHNGSRYVVASVRPSDAQRILVDNMKNYSKQARGYNLLRILLGNGLLTSEGEIWRRQRRIANPAFHHQSIAGFATTMVKAANEMIDNWSGVVEHRGILDLTPEMMKVTLRIAGETLLGFDPSTQAERVGKNLQIALAHVSNRARSPLVIPEEWPLPENIRFKKAVDQLNSVVLDIIRSRREKGHEYHDLLGMFMDSVDDETGERMNDQQLRDEVMTMFLAGHETTAVTLTWLIDLLSRHPAVYRRVKDEIDSALDGNPPSLDDLAKLPLLERTVKECLRLYPPVPILARRAEEDDNLNGYFVKAGGFVAVIPFLIHRHPAYWENPLAFDPDRFLPDRMAQMPKFAYFPFSGGARKCIGDTFAMMEARLVAAVMLQRVKFGPVAPTPPRYLAAVTLRPKDKVEFCVAKA